MSCSLEGIQLSVDGENFTTDDSSKNEIVTVLNNAISDRPELALMLEDNAESFLETFQIFADENYKKAKKMFPDMTCEEFCYCSAAGYAEGYNKDGDDFELGYIPLCHKRWIANLYTRTRPD